jgi:hypothetical protein
MRVHHRGRPDEVLLPASWPALVDRDKHDAVVALLQAPERNSAAPARPGSREHLLSWGIAECGVCGGHLKVGHRGNTRYGVRRQLYVCEGADHVGRDKERVDLFVSHVVVERLKRPDLADLLAGDNEAERAALKKVEGIRGRLAQAADDFADEKITADQLHRITARLKPDLAAAERRARGFRVSPHVRFVLDLAGERAEEAWAGLAVSQRHAVIGVLVERIRIMPVKRKGPGFDPTTIEVVWRRDPVGYEKSQAA